MRANSGSAGLTSPGATAVELKMSKVHLMGRLCRIRNWKGSENAPSHRESHRDISSAGAFSGAMR
jgi:hypothetical protein